MDDTNLSNKVRTTKTQVIEVTAENWRTLWLHLGKPPSEIEDFGRGRHFDIAGMRFWTSELALTAIGWTDHQPQNAYARSGTTVNPYGGI